MGEKKIRPSASLTSLQSTHSISIQDFYEFLSLSKTEFEKTYGSPNRSKISIQDFDIQRTIGVGSFSKVVLAKSKEDTYHAIKVMSKEFIVGLNAQQYALRERHVTRSVSFPFIIQVQATFHDNANLYICMPFVNGGDLFNLLKVQEGMSEKYATFYVAQIVLCLEYLHYLGLVYRDLKPENVLIDSLGYIKMVDFGFCKRLKGRTYTFCGTPEYMAPEIILGKAYGRAVDFWALGVLTYEMVAGRVPYQAADPVRLYEKIGRATELFMPPDFSMALRAFVNGLLEPDSTRRMGCLKKGIEEVKTHPWLQKINWTAILDRTVDPPIVPKVKNAADSSHYEAFEDLTISYTAEDKYAKFFADF